MTKAEEVWRRVEELVAAGTSKAEAFKKLSAEYSQPVNSIRGSYYQWTRSQGDAEGEPRRPRRRETTPEDALSDARKVLERAIEAVDREVDAAKVRADEAQAEHKALKESAEARKQAIRTRLEALV